MKSHFKVFIASTLFFLSLVKPRVCLRRRTLDLVVQNFDAQTGAPETDVVSSTNSSVVQRRCIPCGAAYGGGSMVLGGADVLASPPPAPGSMQGSGSLAAAMTMQNPNGARGVGVGETSGLGAANMQGLGQGAGIPGLPMGGVPLGRDIRSGLMMGPEQDMSLGTDLSYSDLYGIGAPNSDLNSPKQDPKTGPTSSTLSQSNATKSSKTEPNSLAPAAGARLSSTDTTKSGSGTGKSGNNPTTSDSLLSRVTAKNSTATVPLSVNSTKKGEPKAPERLPVVHSVDRLKTNQLPTPSLPLDKKNETRKVSPPLPVAQPGVTGSRGTSTGQIDANLNDSDCEECEKTKQLKETGVESFFMKMFESITLSNPLQGSNGSLVISGNFSFVINSTISISDVINQSILDNSTIDQSLVKGFQPVSNGDRTASLGNPAALKEIQTGSRFDQTTNKTNNSTSKNDHSHKKNVQISPVQDKKVMVKDLAPHSAINQNAQPNLAIETKKLT